MSHPLAPATRNQLQFVRRLALVLAATLGHMPGCALADGLDGRPPEPTRWTATPHVGPRPGRGRLRALWAGADAPRFALDVDQDGVVIGHLAAMVPIWGSPSRSGTFAALWPQLEVEGSPIPYEYWRGRLALEVGRPAAVAIGDQEFGLEVSGGVMHESDHVTLYDPYHDAWLRGTVAVVLNDVFGRLTVHTTVGHWYLATTVTPRLHVLTCTAPYSACETGTEGSATVGGVVDLVAVSLRPWVWGLRPFVSGRAEGHLENDRALAEQRIALRAGLAVVHGPEGAWQIATEVRAGDGVGVLRGHPDTERRGLLSLAWCP